MNSEHRKTITKNIDKLVEGTDLNALVPKLLEKGVFLKNMALKYQIGKGEWDRNLRRDLYFDIQTRGPSAFRNLVLALDESGHGNLALLLEPGFIEQQSNRQHGVRPFVMPGYISEAFPGLKENISEIAVRHPNVQVNLRTEPLKVLVKKATHPVEYATSYKTAIYSMGSRPKGYALIINIKKYINDIKDERFGAEQDEKNLKQLFQGLDYVVTIENNLCADEMKKKLRDFSWDRKHAHVDSCVLAILCHGEQVNGETHFFAADGKCISVTFVLELFTNEQCTYLQKKPKIFLFQSCRGDGKVHGIKADSIRTEMDGISPHLLRKYSDMLIAYATVDGHQSHRDCFLGTWFIQAVCEVFMKHACDTEIMEMLKLVDKELENLVSESATMQTTCFENRGFKTFFFNPGIYDDEKALS